MYSGDLGGFATKANVGVLNAAPVNYTGTAVRLLPRTALKSMTVYQAGVQTSFAGFTLGASVKWGQVGNSYSFMPKGARNGVAYIVNGTYVIGPYVVGASFFDEQSAGGYVPGDVDTLPAPCPNTASPPAPTMWSARTSACSRSTCTVTSISRATPVWATTATRRCRSSRPAPPTSGNGLKHPGRPEQKKGGGQPPPFF